MRVCFIYDRLSGGLPRATLDASVALANKGHDVLVCGPINAHPHFAEEAYKLGVSLENMSQGWFLNFSRNIIKRVSEFNPQVIFSSHRGCDVKASNLACKLGIKHIIIFNANPFTQDEQNPSLYFLRMRNYFWSRAVRKSAKVVCISCYIANAIKKRFNLDSGKIAMILHSANLEKFLCTKIKDLPEKTKPIKLLAVGRLSEEKRPDLFVELVRLLNATAEYRFLATWAGDGELQDDIEQLIEASGLSGQITLAGDVKHVEDEYKDADIFVHFRTDEAAGVVFIEAQSAGVPVIAFNSGGIPDYVEDGKTGLLCEPLNIQEMKEKILRLVSNREMYCSMSVAGV
ncbi:hypothetical protein MNBD_NITROSPINAE01-252, partial [hydrothermal vent metagenome]